MIVGTAIVAGVVFAFMQVVADRRQSRRMTFANALGITMAAVGLWAWNGGLDIWVVALFLPSAVVTLFTAVRSFNADSRKTRPESGDKRRLIKWGLTAVLGTVAWVATTGIVFGFGEAEIPFWWSTIPLGLMVVYMTAIIAAVIYYRQRRHTTR